jgi:sugar O-acyltransferase (sialic acid O-acetyltransferase NeuD family)
MIQNQPARLVIFGSSNILSDLFDCALANNLNISKIVLHLPEETGPRDKCLQERVAALAPLGQFPVIIPLEQFAPEDGEIYILGPTTPSRAALEKILTEKYALTFTCLIHPTAYVSPLASLNEGVYIGANSVIAPGVVLHKHVFVNRSVTIGHDTQIGAFSRIQPGANLGGLSKIGRAVTVGIGASLIERLVVGDEAFIGAGAVLTQDVESKVLVAGIPAKFKKTLV